MTPKGAPPSGAAPAPLHLLPVASTYLDEAAAAGRLYAVIDGCAVPGLARLIGAYNQDRAACLYLGSAAKNYGDKAPYLVQVDGARLKAFDDITKNDAWGCFLVSEASFNAVRLHLRGLLTVSSPEGEAWLFRFWDPRLLPIFLQASQPEELNALFGPVAAFALLDGEGAVYAAWRDPSIQGVAAARAVGARFAVSRGHVVALRRAGMADSLAKSFVSPQQARRDPENDTVLVRGPDGGVMRMIPGEDGSIGAVVSPSGRRWSMDYREDGKLARLVTPTGSVLDIRHDAAGNVASVSRDGVERFQARHDLNGRLQRVDFPDGTAAHTAYALEGRAALADPGGDLVSARRDRTGHVEQFAYDQDHRLVAAVDGAGNATRFVYETADRPDAALFADGGRETYNYDPAGNLSWLVRTDGASLKVRCDDRGRPLRIASDDGGESTFEYDDEGRLVAARNAQCDLAWRYDAEGRLVEERQGEVIVGYEYDAAGLVGLTYPTGETVRYRRDLDQRIVQVSDWSGELYRIDYAGQDAAWRMTGPDGVLSTAWQDRAGLTTAVKVEVGGEALWDAVYAYDAEDRLRERRDARLGAVTYDYDAESQLVGVTRGSGGERFAYDGAGNRTACTAGAATFDSLNRMLSQGAHRFAYDDRGAMLEREGPDGAWRFDYDSFDRLISAEDEWGRRVTFGYDPLGRRLWKRSVAGPVEAMTHFVWAGEQVIRETTEVTGQDYVWDVDAAAKPGARDYLFWPQGWTPLLTRQDGVVYRYHTDPNGVPVRLTAPGGRTVWEAEVEAFGKARVRVAEVVQPWRLPGQYADEDFDLDLHYNRFRYYDPSIGRYISRDPIGVAGGLNLYLYAGNDPVNRGDPLGLWWKMALTILAAVAVAAVVVLTAPISGPLLLVAAGAAAGFAGGAVNEALNQETFCLHCIFLAGLKGAAVGVIATVPFLFLPATAGYAALAGVGAVSGFIGYAADWAMTPGAEWSWKAAAISTGLGAVMGPAGKFVGGKIAARRPVSSAPEPVAEPPVTPAKAVAASADGVSANGGSTYSQRLAQTPVSNGSWTGVRGESTFVSTHPDVVPILGQKGIVYKNAYPDFSPVAADQVEIANMSASRSSNFAQADKALAQKLGQTPSDVKAWRVDNKYTWHEVEDLKTMQLVPTQVNGKFGHLGGVGEINAGMTKPGG